ncbi:hypothetical protein C8Q78DRAFT_1082972 [Trametes maxima]|nr:hypothetical protein C8Q78DRAFT_1082972 [Trametes maxima]
MIPRLTRTGRIFSPYNLGKNFDAAQLIERAPLDIDGADHWDITPVEPLSPSFLEALLSPLPSLTPSPEAPSATSPLLCTPAGSVVRNTVIPELSLPPLLGGPTPVMDVDPAQAPSALMVCTGAGSGATRLLKWGRTTSPSPPTQPAGAPVSD